LCSFYIICDVGSAEIMMTSCQPSSEAAVRLPATRGCHNRVCLSLVLVRLSVPYLKRHRVPTTDWDALWSDVHRMTFCVRTVGAIRSLTVHNSPQSTVDWWWLVASILYLNPILILIPRSPRVTEVLLWFSAKVQHKLKIDRNCSDRSIRIDSNRIDSFAVEFSYERLISAKLHTCNFKMLPSAECWVATATKQQQKQKKT